MAAINEEMVQAKETELILAKMSKKKHSKLTANDLEGLGKGLAANQTVEKELSIDSYESKASRTGNVKREMKIHQKSKYRGIDDINNLKDLFGKNKTLKKQENIE